MNGYIGFHNGKEYEVYAETPFEAQKKLAKQLGVPDNKSWQVAVMIAEKNGEPVIHSTLDLQSFEVSPKDLTNAPKESIMSTERKAEATNEDDSRTQTAVPTEPKAVKS